MLSRRVASLGGVGLAGTLIVAAACGDETAQSLQLGKYVTLHFAVATDDVLCDGTGAHLDRYIERVFEFLAAPVPDDFHLDVRFVEQNPCDDSFVGCYRLDDRTVYIEKFEQFVSRPAGLLRHEIAHAVVDQVWGWSAPFFNEGIAEALAASWPTPPDSSLEKADFGTLVGADKSFDYASAARFTRFLIDTRGRENYRRVHQRARDRSGAEIHAILAEVYGEPLESLAAEYRNGEPRCAYQLDLCDPERAIDVTRGWSTTLTASCSGDGAYGGTYVPLQGPPVPRYGFDWTLAVESAGSYRLRSTSALRLVQCGGSCEEQAIVWFEPGIPTDVELELAPGLYSVDVVFAGEAGTHPIEIGPVQ